MGNSTIINDKKTPIGDFQNLLPGMDFLQRTPLGPPLEFLPLGFVFPLEPEGFFIHADFLGGEFDTRVGGSRWISKLQDSKEVE
jgi:hypothetical protein